MSSLTEDKSSLRSGYRYAIFAYSIWGLFPIYWKLLSHVAPLEVLFHRVLWSAVYYAILLRYAKLARFPSLRLILEWRWPILFASVLIGVNWGMYIYAVQKGLVLDASLGYFINPLLNVALGVFVFNESLNRTKKLAFFFAFIGVLTITIESGRFPWIAFVLGTSFALYGVAKKKIQLSSLQSGFLESLFLLPVLIILIWVSPNQSFHLSFDKISWVLLIGAGLVTGTPLLWFTEAAKRLPYSTLGFFQYIAPTFQFLTGVYIYNEPLSLGKLLGFVLIWSGLSFLIFSNLRLRKF